MNRTPQDVFTAHAGALATGDPDAVAADYAEDAVLLTPEAVHSGRAAIREFYAGALTALPGAEFSLGSLVVAGDALLVTWSATSAGGRVSDGVDTFVLDGDRIRLQTTVFHLATGG